MSQGFESLDPLQLHESPFKLIGKDWMLVTAGSLAHFNTMTASWGMLGHLWERPVAFAFVRPQRYTFEFMETYDAFTLSFFNHRQYRETLLYCGTHSGRDVDKMAATGLRPLSVGLNTVTFEQARLVLVCRKLYAQDLTPESFVAPEIDSSIYAAKDYHRVYVGEVVEALVKQETQGVA
ncbi:MAG: flavin reductase [Anaerolineae bacterium]|nr:flavin reductase [Anaerolineae bacterium]